MSNGLCQYKETQKVLEEEAAAGGGCRVTKRIFINLLVQHLFSYFILPHLLRYIICLLYTSDAADE